jgi:hypothetical protein
MTIEILNLNIYTREDVVHLSLLISMVQETCNFAQKSGFTPWK